MSVASSRVSIALLLLRIVVNKWHITILKVIVLMTTLLYCVTTILLFVQLKVSSPHQEQAVLNTNRWTLLTIVVMIAGGTLRSGYTPSRRLLKYSSVWSVIADLALAVLPWHIVLALHIKPARMIAIACSLSLSIFPALCSILRNIAWASASFSGRDYAYHASPTLLWSSSEACLSIICACIPTLRPLYLNFLRIQYEFLAHQPQMLNEFLQARDCILGRCSRQLPLCYSFVAPCEDSCQDYA